MKRALAAALLLASCKGGVEDLGATAAPVLVLRGRVEGPWPSGATQIRAGILWAAVPEFIPYCHRYGPNPLEPDRYTTAFARKGCRDPFEVVPGRVGPSAPVDPETRTFTIRLEQLPDPAILVGPLGARVAYASIVIYDDVDRDGDLRVGSPCRRAAGNPGNPNRGGGVAGTLGPGTFAGVDAGPLIAPIAPPRDPVHAASFSALTRPQTRLAYVEGAFDASSNYYPHPRCTALPGPGFSLWDVGSLHDPAATCAVRGVDQELVMAFDPDPKLVNLTCAQRTREVFSRSPAARSGWRLPSGSGLLWECTEDGDIAVVDQECECPEISVYSLRGCFDEVDCAVPDWDFWNDPSVQAQEIRARWPCADPRTGVSGT